MVQEGYQWSRLGFLPWRVWDRKASQDSKVGCQVVCKVVGRGWVQHLRSENHRCYQTPSGRYNFCINSFCMIKVNRKEHGTNSMLFSTLHMLLQLGIAKHMYFHASSRLWPACYDTQHEVCTPVKSKPLLSWIFLFYAKSNKLGYSTTSKDLNY